MDNYRHYLQQNSPDNWTLLIKLSLHCLYCKVPLCALLTTSLWMYNNKTYAEEYFNINALEIHSGFEDIDLSIFTQDDQQPPGRYWVDIYLNREKVIQGMSILLSSITSYLPKLRYNNSRILG
ncbi:FimD/PapC N-terminal domain-containing protein [Xenorhabdus thailandensis]|uniref:FimD/PapC N-terminal domain-containing protein n=1 Tax=Xenorhabdus thailandensis TaxID=3136255 RepID=UPI0030F38AF7